MDLLVQRFEATKLSDLARERIFDDLDLPMILRPTPTMPSRTTSGVELKQIVPQTRARSRHRPDAMTEWRRPPRSVRWLKSRLAIKWIDEARAAMLTRNRDLDTIAYANPKDVVEVIDEPGLRFVGFGIRPERRFLLEGTYVFLVIQNGVPVGYMQGSGLCGWAEINFNIFDPFRGRDAGRLYGRSLAVLRAVMGTSTFVLSPYQLGDGNEEAIESGAFWFYYKFGYRPRDARGKALVRAEVSALKRDSKYRSSAMKLRRLAERPMFLSLAKERASLAYGAVGKIGLLASGNISCRSSGDRDKAIAELTREATRALGLRATELKRWSPSEKQALRNWSAFLTLVPGIARWSPDDRKGLAKIVRARGGNSESAYLKLLSSHGRFVRALAKL